MLKLKPKRKPLKSSIPKIGCPFCWEWLPKPKRFLHVFSGDGCLGGRCECGAYFVIDETGRSGGQALIDVQALACEGDLERALKLREDIDFELKKKAYQKSTDAYGAGVRGHPEMQPKAWAIKLKDT